MSIRDRFSFQVCDGDLDVVANSAHLALTIRSFITGTSTGIILDDSEVEDVLNNLNLWLAAKRAGLLSDDDGSI